MLLSQIGADWRRNWSTAGWELAERRPYSFGAGPSETNPGQFSWVTFIEAGPIPVQIGSGFAPTMAAAKRCAEVFADRYADLKARYTP